MKACLCALLLLFLSCLESERSPDFLLSQNNPYHNFFFFTRPDHEASLIEKRRPLEAALSVIDSAERELLVFCYGLDQEELVQALERARSRGVRLRLIGDPEETYPLLEGQGFLIERRERSGLQHVKLILADQQHLFTGTGNFTRSGFFHNNNAFWKFSLSSTQATMLEEMLLENQSHILRLPDTRILVSPGQGKLIQLVILQAILDARYSIQFSMYSFTDPLIMAALLRRSMEGLLVEGIVDDPSHQGKLPVTGQAIALNRLAAAHPLFLYADGNNNVFSRGDLLAGGHMHHKTLIIDGRRVLSGSYNWSLSARDSNLEIFFDFENAWIAQLFSVDFARSRKWAFLASRSPFSGPVPRLEECEAGTALLYQGPWPFLRMQEMRQDAGCENQKTTTVGPTFSPSEEGIRLTYHSDGGARLSGGPFAAPVPDPLASEVFNAERARLDQGWIWLRSPILAQEAVVWQKGRNVRYELSAELTDFVELPQGIPGDALVLLHGATSQYLGCVQSGTTLDQDIALFLQLAEYYYGKKITCSRE
ncbi:MAG: DUF1669 domain-containing protein [Spirochaetales bacterium]|nr:DUF1669 domain-containing protein [Spirochaetales bacterium]